MCRCQECARRRWFFEDAQAGPKNPGCFFVSRAVLCPHKGFSVLSKRSFWCRHGLSGVVAFFGKFLFYLSIVFQAPVSFGRI